MAGPASPASAAWGERGERLRETRGYEPLDQGLVMEGGRDRSMDGGVEEDPES